VKRLCVFCGSSAGEDRRYLDAATEVGELLARKGIELVYGGSRVGMMGRLADAALAADGRVVGIIPEALVNREVAHRGLAELRIVESMHERKAEMARMADGFLALPGGLGTLEELCEVLTWAQLGLHGKPCGVLDVKNYFQPLVELLDHMVREGFLSRNHRGMVLVEASADRLLDRMKAYDPPPVPRWIDAGQT
jgi:hypothetical protein